MKNICTYLLIMSLLVFNSCSYKLVPSSKNQGFKVNTHFQLETLKSLKVSIEKIVNAGGNLRRKRSVLERINELSLSKFTSIENIDWLSFQKNILIEIKGKSDKIVYVVSHYDKTDNNPLSLPNNLLNGVLDPLISWSYTSHGAIDNATGVALSLQLAKKISEENLNHTYRILLVGSEESGLRGSRAHMARITEKVNDNIFYVINTDIIGVKGKTNCVTSNISSKKLVDISLNIAEELNIELDKGILPSMSSSDYAPFQKTSFLIDFKRSLQFNLIGAFLPQRSYFTKKKENQVINFSSCDLLGVKDYVGSILLMPIGTIHGFRDHIKLVDEKKLYEQYILTYELIKTMDQKKDFTSLQF